MEFMGLLSKVMKAGVAKKAYDEARKPENQRRAKEFVASMRDKRRSSGGRTGRDGTPPSRDGMPPR